MAPSYVSTVSSDALRRWRSTKTGGHGPRLCDLMARSRPRRRRSTKTGGHGPRLSAGWTGCTTPAPLNEDRGPWPPVMRPGCAVTCAAVHAQRRPGAMAPGYGRERLRRLPRVGGAQRRPGAMAPGYLGDTKYMRSTDDRSTKTGGHGPRLSDRPPRGRCRRRPLNEDRGPWPPVIGKSRDEIAVAAGRSTKTGGHGPRLFGPPVALVLELCAQRRPGAMAPGYTQTSVSELAPAIAQRRPGAMAPGYGPGDGGSKPPVSPLNEDRGPWPPVMRQLLQ